MGTAPSHWTRLAAAACAAALLAGCATFSDKPPETQVKERAKLRWTQLVAGDLDSAYKLMPPSYRAITTAERYKRGFQSAVKWVAADVMWVKCETDDKCIANIKLDAEVLTMRNAPPITTYFDETWIREDGRWWLFPTP